MALSDFTQVGGTDLVAYNLSDGPSWGGGSNVLGLVDASVGQGFTGLEENHLQNDAMGSAQTNVRMKCDAKLVNSTATAGRFTKLILTSHAQSDAATADRYYVEVVNQDSPSTVVAKAFKVESGVTTQLVQLLPGLEAVLLPNAPDDWNHFVYETFVTGGQTHLRVSVAASDVAAAVTLVDVIDGVNQVGAGRVRLGGEISFSVQADHRLLIDNLEFDTLS